MTRLVVVSGDARPESPASRLAVAVGDALADGSPPTLIEVGADVAPGPAVDEADPAARINDGP